MEQLLSKYFFCFREQYLFNVFEVIVSTLESKLQRIENLDRAVEHLMRRVEALDSRVNDNIDKTDSVINRLKQIDSKLYQPPPDPNLDKRLVSLDRKVTDIDSKLVGLKNQLDTNFLQADDFNAEASEKKPVSTSVLDISKVLGTELEALRGSTATIDRKLQFHINLVSESLGKIIGMMGDVHDAVVEPVVVQTGQPSGFRNRTTTVPPPSVLKNSKLDKLVRQMHPMLSVSNKMDEVWNVVVGTKSSVDDLVPKSDILLTQTQRQERAINDIHADLRANTNKIIANLGMVEKRLKKQEEDVITLANRGPVAAELLLDPTIDRLVEYDPVRVDEPPQPVTETVVSSEPAPPSTFTTSAPAPASSTRTAPTRNRGVIFPSVKNKPSPANTTFLTDQALPAAIRDVKVILSAIAAFRESSI